METILSSTKSQQKPLQHQLKKPQQQQPHLQQQLSHSSKLLPDDLYRAVTRPSKNYRNCNEPPKQQQQQKNTQQPHLQPHQKVHQKHKPAKLHRINGDFDDAKANVNCAPLSSSSSTSSLASIASSASITATTTTDNMSKSTSLSSSSCESDTEIPVWIHGEQRWISGITNDTTCGQLVDALLRNEGLSGEPASLPTAKVAPTTAMAPMAGTKIAASASMAAEHQYVITERWRRVEQMLDNKTKILKIWRAWGETKSEVRLTLRRIDILAHKSRHINGGTGNCNHSLNRVVVDYDSGRESGATERGAETGSAIVRRKRHRSTKSTPTWTTHARTIHPKSSKATIEKLMKLILEQGETIQQQLSKLRDRDHQIAKIEEYGGRAHHLMRENEIGKNYLLEAYLNGFRENNNDGDENDNNDDENNENDVDDDDDDKAITTPGNSDSGVNTEDITTSPEVGLSSPLPNGSSTSSAEIGNSSCHTNTSHSEMFDVKPATDNNTVKRPSTREQQQQLQQHQQQQQKQTKKHSAHKSIISSKKTSREAKLLREHENRKEFCENQQKTRCSDECIGNLETNDNTAHEEIVDPDKDHLAGQIELLEKVVAINKHIQREEELLVRLNAKIRKYEVDDPNLTEMEIKKALQHINANIEASANQMKHMEKELDASNELLMSKANMISDLNRELEALEFIDSNNGDNNNQKKVIRIPSHHVQIHTDYRQQQEQYHHQQRPQHQQQQQSPHLMLPSPSKSRSRPLPSDVVKMETLPKLTPPTITKAAFAKPTICGTIPKTQRCIQIPSTSINNMNAAPPIPSVNAVFDVKNQSYIVPDHIILSQVPLFFQKENSNDNFIQTDDQRNLNHNNSSSNNITNNNHNTNNINKNQYNCNNNNINFNTSMANCGKVGPKKMMLNGFYKDPDSDTGLSSLGEDGSQLGTLV